MNPHLKLMLFLLTTPVPPLRAQPDIAIMPGPACPPGVRSMDPALADAELHPAGKD